MKYLAICLISTINVTAFISLTMLSYAKQPVIVSVQEDSSMSCNSSIDLVKSELSKKGFFVPWKIPGSGTVGKPQVKIDTSTIRDGYYDYPETRTETIVFVLGEVDNLYSSPKYMATLASKIMAECNNIGLVKFAYWWEGEVSIGYFPDNTAREFINLYAQSEDEFELLTKAVKTSEGDRRIFKWGYSFSP